MSHTLITIKLTKLTFPLLYFVSGTTVAEGSLCCVKNLVSKSIWIKSRLLGPKGTFGDFYGVQIQTNINIIVHEQGAENENTAGSCQTIG